METVGAYMLSKAFSIAAFKGVRQTIRSWNQQLRQPLLTSEGYIVVFVSPEEGLVHQFTELDILGRRSARDQMQEGAMSAIEKANAEPSELITIRQAAEVLGITVRTANRWVAAGEMPNRIKDGRTKKFRREDIVRKAKAEFVELITLDEAAKMLNLSIRTLRRWVAAGKMPARTKRGTQKKFWRAEIEQLMNKR
jgi:excisionase family DNA binding protein